MRNLTWNVKCKIEHNCYFEFTYIAKQHGRPVLRNQLTTRLVVEAKIPRPEVKGLFATTADWVMSWLCNTAWSCLFAFIPYFICIIICIFFEARQFLKRAKVYIYLRGRQCPLLLNKLIEQQDIVTTQFCGLRLYKAFGDMSPPPPHHHPPTTTPTPPPPPHPPTPTPPHPKNGGDYLQGRSKLWSSARDLHPLHTGCCIIFIWYVPTANNAGEGLIQILVSRWRWHHWLESGWSGEWRNRHLKVEGRKCKQFDYIR